MQSACLQWCAQGGDESGAHDRTVGFEQILPEFPDVRLVLVGQVVLVDEEGAFAHDESSAAGALPGLTEVEADLDDFAVVGDPLCFGFVGDEVVVECRAELHSSRLRRARFLDDP